MSNSEALKALAINGGSKAVTAPLPERHHFGAEEKAACDRVIDEAIANGVAPGYGGKEEEIFCKEFAEMMGGGYADAVNSGTTSVFVALRALNIEPFTEIICGPVTDPGGLMPIVMMNCIPVIADSEPGSFNMSLEGVKKVYTENTSAIVVPHIAGEPADIEAICAFAKEKGLKVVEDCAQAHGATVHGKRVGTFGDAAGYSMMFGKHTCVGGQGGVCFTKDEDTYWRIRQNSDRGKPFGLPAGSDNCVGSLNFNMDEMHCAIGRVQIKKTADIAKNRRRVVYGIMDALKDVPALTMSKLPEGAEPSFWFMRLLYNQDMMTCDKETFCKAVSAEGINCNVRYAATPYTAFWYTERRVFGNSGYPWAAPEYKGDRSKVYTLADLPNAAKALDDTIIIYPVESWTDENIAQCANAFRKVYEAYKK